MDDYVMIFVPHQDDEICLMGEYLNRHLYKNDVKIKLVYLTNGDYITAATTRQLEALKAVRIFGIEEKDVIFLGYPDTPFESNMPYTASRLNAITLTIEQTILRFTPNIIFCTDWEPHPDHRALSLCFNRAMASILKGIEEYRPTVLKGFAYSTAFYGKKDYARINNPPTIIPAPAQPGYPSLNWNTEIRLKNPSAVNQTPLWNNKIYKALLSHKSQCGLKYYQSIINGDQVFFNKRTDNLLLSNMSELEVSSGIKDYLNDFLSGCFGGIMDCNNLSELQNCIWKPDKQDLSPKISIRFRQPQSIEYISMNGNPNLQKQRTCGEIHINRKQIIQFQKLDEFGKETRFYIRNQEVHSIYFILQHPCSGISGLGIFRNEDNPDYLFLSVMPSTSKSNKCNYTLINYLEWLYIRISRANFRLNRKINYLAKRIRKT